MPDPEPRHGRPDTPADAVRLHRARVLERLAASAWHELASPIGGLRGFATLLRQEGWTAEQLGIDPALIEEAAAQTQLLARAFTDLARPAPRAAPLPEVIAGTMALAGHLLVDTSVTIDIPPDLPDPDADPALLRLVLASLVLERVAGADAAAPRTPPRSMAWRARPADGGLELILDDDGAPASPSELALLQALLAADGATLRVEAPAGGGSRAVLVLPSLRLAAGTDRGRPAPAAAAPHAMAAERARDVATPRVLVVDDQATVREMIMRFAERESMRVTAVSSGAEALEALETTAVEVIVVDHRMAGMSGPELHAAVAARHPSLRRRFVMISGNAGDPDLVAFAAAEDLPVLGKPFDVARLIEVVRAVAAR